MVDFLFNGLLFLLVGLQLRTILHEPLPHGPAILAVFGVAIAVTVILTRIAWVFPATYLPRWLSPGLRARDPIPEAKHVFVLAWTGMRGGISLAAALALPAVLASGQPFPGRGEIVFLTFMVILCTLVFQGLTLPVVIRRLDIQTDGSQEREANEARLVGARAGLVRLDAVAESDGITRDLYEPLRRHYQEEINRLCIECGDEPDPAYATRVKILDRMWGEALQAERQAVVRMRDDGTIGDDVLNLLLAELDLEAVWLAEPTGAERH
jgi:CPA1 family monovalent cation:H+ antiporter